MNQPSFFEIQADDVKRASNFYSQAFGWKFTKVEGLPVEYWLIQTEGSRGGLLQRPVPAPPPQSGTNAFACSMQVEHIDVVTQKILDLGAKIALPKFAVPGTCWQAYFIDTEGNTFGIFEVDEQAK
jgi:predicted enzyme related to lactoylglutathione lyase